MIGRGRNHKVCKNEILINDFIDYMRASYDESIYGTPYSRKEGKFAHYKGEQ